MAKEPTTGKWTSLTPQTRQKINDAMSLAYKFTYHSGLDARTRLVMRAYLRAVSSWQDELDLAEAEIRLALGVHDEDPVEWVRHGKPVADSLLGRLMRPAGEAPNSQGQP